MEVKMMDKAKLSKRFMPFLLLTVAALALPENAFANYASSCAACHGPIGGPGTGIAPPVSNKTATGIQAAINTVPAMGGLTSLMPAQVAAISAELAPVVTPPPGGTPPPVVPPPTPTPTACNPPSQVINGVCTLPISGAVGKATSGAARTDVYKVTCGKGTKYLSVAVKDLIPVNPSKVSIQSSKDSASSALRTDKSDGDDSYSRTIILDRDSGVYRVKVNKSESSTIGAEAYDAQINCKNAKGVRKDTKVKIIQNQ
jgi:hypothetical protein